MNIKIHNPNNLPTIDYREVEEFQGNLKDLTKDNYAKLKKSIEENGFFIPMFLWKHKSKFKVLDAHQRLRVLKKEKAQPYEIPYIEIEAKDEHEAKKKLLLISSQYGTITREGLDEFAFDLDTDWMKDTINFDNVFDFDKIDVQEDDYEVPDKIETDIKLGDMFQLSDHRLLCGDATKTKDVELLMGGQKADMVFTDPPYGINKDGIENDNLKGADFEKFNDKYISILPVKNDCAFVCYHSTRTFNITINSAIKHGWKFEKMLFFYRPDKFPVHTWNGWMMTSQAILLFSKGNPKYLKISPAHQDVYKITSSDLSEKKVNHPTVKPVIHYCDVINHFKGDLILDLFGGSGSTLIACEELNRKCYMMEIRPEYCQIIIDRWEKLINKKAEKIK